MADDLTAALADDEVKTCDSCPGRAIVKDAYAGWVHEDTYDPGCTNGVTWAHPADCDGNCWGEGEGDDASEDDDTAGCDDVVSLYHWSLNFDPGKGPFVLFLDLIGWSEDEFGGPVYQLSETSLGAYELRELADALRQYVEKPEDVRRCVAALLAAEGEGE